jgi:hypothetical protein
VGNVKLKAEAVLQSSVNRLEPITDESTLQRGENLKYAGAAMPYVTFNTFGEKDTLSIHFSTERGELIRYNGSKLTTHNTRSALNYVNNFSFNAYKGALMGRGGYVFVKLNGELELYPLWKASLLNAVAGQELRLFALQDILPPCIPFDTTKFLIMPGYLVDVYQSMGAELQLRFNKVGLLLGSCLVNGVSKSSVEKVWPDGIPPYEESRWVFTAAPSFGRWHGLSGISQWMFSEKRPFIKSKSVLSCDINRTGKALHLIFDLGFDYWSEREYLYYGGIDTWNRPIYDLHLKTTAHIKTFRLFYKIDNLFNRKIAYLPGYYMPGLVFRWGFNWLIQG